MIPRILSIAGSDSGGGAGIQADVKTITMLGGHAMTAITAITAQNTLGVDAILPLPAEMVVAQIDAVAGDIGVDAIKIGMIGSAAVAEAVADRLRRPDLRDVPIVFDPVMVASTGARLADAATTFAFVRLLNHATLSTPNRDELAVLAGMTIESEMDVEIAADTLIDRGAGPILTTGVALSGGAVRWLEGGALLERGTDERLFDILRTGDPERDAFWEAARIDTIHDHGTGCTLSSGIATGLGAGLALEEAIGHARYYVRATLNAAPRLGGGHGPMGHGLGRAHFPTL